jgi:hypothetical protein
MTLPRAHFVTAPRQPALAGTASNGARRSHAEKAPETVAGPGRPPWHAHPDDSHPASGPEALRERRRGRGQVALLCWTHSVIGFGFFGAPWRRGLLPPSAAAAVQLLHVCQHQRNAVHALMAQYACHRSLRARLQHSEHDMAAIMTLSAYRHPHKMYTRHPTVLTIGEHNAICVLSQTHIHS